MDRSINEKSLQKITIHCYLLEVVAGRLVNFGVEEPIGRSERGSCSACYKCQEQGTNGETHSE